MENCVKNEEDLVESNLDFIREVSMIHVNFIIIVVIVSDKKKSRKYYFRPTSRNIRQ